MLVKLKQPLRDEAGSALVSVLITMVVLSLFAVTLAAVVTNTTRSLVGTQGSAQARQAADAGLAHAVAAFRRTTNCSLATASRDDAPAYDVACAVVGSRVTFVSTGHAPNGGNATVKAAYDFEIVEMDEGVDEFTFYSGATFTAETDTVSGDGLLRITVATGNLTCQNRMAASLVIAGDFLGNGSCVVEGDVWAGGRVNSTNPDVIMGDAVSAATTGTNSWYGRIGGDFTSGTDVELPWSSSQGVTGTLRSSGNVTLHDAKVGGNLVVPASKMATASWRTSVDLPAGGHAQVGGSIVRPSTVAPPAAPAYLPWRDYAFSHADWGGYALVVLTAAECSTFNSWPNQGWKDLAHLPGPTVVDARACSGGLTSNSGGNPTPALKHNLVIVASQFNLTSLKVTESATAVGHPKLWLIVPDTIDNDAPGGSGTIELNSTHLRLPTFLYTPGTIRVSGGGTFTGTMYSGGFSYGGPIDLEGIKVSFPGGGVAGGADGAGAGGLTMTKILQRACTNEACDVA